ncbi:hypothetical protein ZIOFF_034716 [Zingiber officinale]|uniref:Auxin-responsive protein n=1 Tax=Zingiber officinale TaxID=94328 RepID=A0A8J5G8C6_ZINOF|nr:hypothetical protein ZIOFF_034716 [Zingiber officinale]
MKEDGEKLSNPMASFMKVRMDSPPYLHKVDPKMYKSYQELSMALQKMFGSFTNTGGGSHLHSIQLGGGPQWLDEPHHFMDASTSSFQIRMVISQLSPLINAVYPLPVCHQPRFFLFGPIN